jgi:hypothetical protein
MRNRRGFRSFGVGFGAGVPSTDGEFGVLMRYSVAAFWAVKMFAAVTRLRLPLAVSKPCQRTLSSL